MLRGLPGIRLKSVKLAYTILRNISTPCMNLRTLLSSGWIHQTPSSGFAPRHVLHMVHLAYLNGGATMHMYEYIEMQ
jgi:hypothetical protein